MDISDDQIRAGLERLAGRDAGLSPKKETTRRRILQAATELLGQHGFRRTSMEHIAERAGISRATLYAYARSKEDIVIKALAEEQLEHRRPWLDPALSPRVRLERLIVDAIVCYERMPLLALLVRGDPDVMRSLENEPEVLEAFAGVDDTQFMVGAIREAFGAVGAERARQVAAVLRALTGVGPHLVEGAPRVGMTPEELARTLAGLLLDGMR